MGDAPRLTDEELARYAEWHFMTPKLPAVVAMAKELQSRRAQSEGAQAKVVEGWQPIDTAPKDGSWFLAHGDGVAIQDCSYVCAWDFDKDGREAWREIYSETEVAPTHWMPLPSPPRQTEETTE